MGWKDYRDNSEDIELTSKPVTPTNNDVSATEVDWKKIIGKNGDITTLTKKIIKAKNPSSLSEYIPLFKLSMYKRSLIRIAKLTELQDVIDNKIIERAQDSYLKTETLLLLSKQISEEIQKSNDIVKELNDTTEKVNNIVNVSVIQNTYNDFSPSSREKIKLAVAASLEKLRAIPVDSCDTDDTQPIMFEDEKQEQETILNSEDDIIE
jgi:hypothetical protein